MPHCLEPAGIVVNFPRSRDFSGRLAWRREPVFTLFGVYPDSGVLLMGLSPCARYLVAVGESCGYYEARLWLWTLGDQRPHGEF